MSGLLHPVGPEPERVYWVRRVLVLLVAVVVLTVAVLAVRAVASGADRAPGTDTADQAGTGAEESADDGAAEVAESPADDEPATEPALSGGPVACDPAALTLTLTADAQSYPAGVEPVFAVALTNTGSAACTVDGGSGNQVVTVTSGADRIWSSADCQGEVGERLLLLDPGAQDVVPVTWDRSRSDEACTNGLAAPRAGTYQAVAVMFDVQSAPVVFDLG